MLKTSPILSNSPNASPTNFRNAPARSPRESPRPPIAKPQRRPPSWTASSPSASSMKPPATGSANPSHSVQRNVATTTGDQPAATPASQPSAVEPPPAEPPAAGPPTSQPDHVAVAAKISSEPTVSTPAVSSAQVKDTLSPNKRRGSPSNDSAPASRPTDSAPQSASASSSQQSLQAAKRAKPEEQPSKVLPQRYEFCAVEDMVELIAHMLAELITTNDAIRISSGGLTRFHSRTAPGISVRDYLHRLAKHATLTPPLLLAMVYYIDRLCALYQEFTINTLTVHRFLITAATVAAKGLSDSFWNNTTYARVGGVRIAELKMLELEFLYRVDWKIVPNPEVLVAYYQGLVERTPGYILEAEESSDEELGDEDEDAEQ